MPNQREIDLIISLRNATKNTSEAKKLENSIKSLHKLAERVNKTLGSKIATKQMNSLKKAIDGATGSLRKFLEGKDTRFKDLQKGIRFVLDIINKLIEASKRSSGELGKLARSNLGKLTSLKDIFTRLQEVTETLPDKFSKIAESTKKIISSSSSASSALQKKATVIQKVSAQYQILIDRLYSYRVASETVISVTNKLEASLRKIQTLGKLKGVSIFEQNIQSTKVFITELEKLRMKLAEINKESIMGRTSVTKNMILEFRRMSEAINEAQIKTKALTVALEELRKAKTSAEAIENLRNALKTMGIELGKGVKSFKTFETAVAKAMNKVKTDLKKSEVTWKEVANLYRKSINQMKENLIKFSQTSFKVWAETRGHLEGTVAILDQSEKKVLRLTQAYEKFKAAGQLVREGVVSLKVAQEAANKVIERANVVIETLGSKYSKNAQQARQMASAFLGIADVSAYLQTRLKTLAGSLVDITRREKVLITASRYLSDSLTLLRQQTALAQERTAFFSNEILRLSARLNILQRATVKDVGAIALLTKRLSLLQIQAKKASTSFNILNNRFMQAEQKAGDASRAMSRMSSQGFANMIISQAAWMAGFQLIFGTLDRFKKAMMAVLETQLAVSRAMRTIRSETKSTAEIYDQLTDAVNRMRMSVGASATETGEALYQLGSAGLSLKESLAALTSTMDTVIGSEADMEQITNLVAGIYNNFGDQIIKVNGRVQTISRTFDGYNKNLIESTTLTEKFQHINDLLVRTFDAHQAEMDQIRDGLKFMAQSAMQANLALTQQLGILATLHDHFIKAGAAGRGMRVIISRITKEAEKFKEAFDLEIDLSAPIDMIDIFRQLHEQMEGNILSVEKLGEFFKRLGLRGVEPLLVLIQNFDELNDNIKDLTENSEDAAKMMRLMRLANLGDQAEIASGKIEVLLKAGLQPLAVMLGLVVAGFNKIGDAVVVTNDAVSGFLGFSVRFVGLVATISLLTIAWKNHAEVISWVLNVFKRLWKTFKTFGQLGVDAGEKLTTLGDAVRVVSGKFTGFFKSLKKGYIDQRNFNVGLVGMGKGMGKLKAMTTVLTGSIMGLSFAMKALLVIAVAFAFYKLIDYVGETNNRLRALVKTQKAKLQVDKKILKNLREEIGDLFLLIKVTKENKQVVQDVAKATGIYATTLDDLNRNLTLIQIRTADMIDQQGKMFEIKRAVLFAQTMKLLEENMKEIAIYGEAGLSIWEKLWIAIKGIAFLSPLITGLVDAFNLWIIVMKKLLGWSQDLVGFFGKLSVSISEKLVGALDRFNQKLKQSHPLLSKVFSFIIGANERAIQGFVRLNKQYSDLASLIANYEKELKAARKQEKLSNTRKETEDIRKHIIELEKIIRVEKDGLVVKYKAIQEARALVEANGDLKEALERVVPPMKGVTQKTSELADGFKDSVMAILSFNSALEQMKMVLASTRTYLASGSDSLSDLQEKLESLGRDQSLNEFRMEVASMSAALKNVGALGQEELNKLLEAAAKLGIEGTRGILNFRKSIEALEQKIKDLNLTISNISLEKLQIELKNSERQAAFLGKEFDALRAATKKYGTRVDETKETLRAGGRALDKYRSAVKASSAAEGTYTKAAANYAAQKKINIILEERHERALKAFKEEVGRGARSLEDIKARTEKYARAVEDAKIALLRVKAALKGAEAGTRKYAEAARDVAAARKDLARAEKEFRGIRKEEKEDLKILKRRLEEEKTARIESIKAIKDTQKTLKEQTDALREEAGQLGDTTKGLGEKAQKYGELKNKIGEQVAALEKEYKEEVKIIKIREKMGDITGEEARALILKANNELIAARKILEDQLKDAMTKQAEAAIALKVKYLEMLESLKESLKALVTVLEKLETAMLTAGKFELDMGDAFKEFNKFKKMVMDWFEKGPGSRNNPFIIYYKYKALNKPPKEGKGSYRGGVIKRAQGGMVPARVTAGEGFIPPGQTQNNLSSLNSLNRGSISSRIPSSIGTFKGPGGVDNIHTYLPVGSYIISKRGMEAYERSANQGAQTFQEGGEVAETESPAVLSSMAEESIGSFTIVVEKGGTTKEFPVTGKISILKGLRDELEEDRLTRLH